jgi:DNA-binding PadR family transcriptional regulator
MDPILKLRNAMKEIVFKDFSFSEERKNAVQDAIKNKQSHSWKESTILIVLESLQHKPRHGYEIATQLFQKQDVTFHNKEGQIYTLLHLLENKKIVASDWNNEKKYYFLTTKGKEYLAKYNQKEPNYSQNLKHILEEASL